MNKLSHRKLWSLCITATVLIGFVAALHPASAEKKQSVQVRLQWLEDCEEIRELLTAYGRYLDKRDFDSFSRLFDEKEGEWIGGMGKAKGRQAIFKLMEDTIGHDTTGKISGPNYHLFTNESIHVKGNEAQAVTKWMFLVQNNSKQPQPFYLGHYEDSFLRTHDGWKFLKRVVYGDIPADDSLSRQ